MSIDSHTRNAILSAAGADVDKKTGDSLKNTPFHVAMYRNEHIEDSLSSVLYYYNQTFSDWFTPIVSRSKHRMISIMLK